MSSIANKKELVHDLVMKAKQVEYLINSLPAPEPEEQQVRYYVFSYKILMDHFDRPRGCRY